MNKLTQREVTSVTVSGIVGGVSTNLQQLEAPLSRGLAVSTEGYVLGRIAVGLGQEWGMCPGQVRVLLAFSHHPSSLGS